MRIVIDPGIHADHLELREVIATGFDGVEGSDVEVRLRPAGRPSRSFTGRAYADPPRSARLASGLRHLVVLFVPTVLACARLAKRGLRRALSSQTVLALAPIAALTVIVAIATGEVRYRIPFDVFFIVIACAYVVGDLERADASAAPDARSAL